MILVRNVHTSRIEKIERGTEGVLPDSASLRAMVKGGLLEVIEGDISGPLSAPAVPSASVALTPVTGTFVHESEARRVVDALRDELDKTRAQLAQVSADRDAFAARLEAAEKALQAASAVDGQASAEKPEKAPEKLGKGKG